MNGDFLNWCYVSVLYFLNGFVLVVIILKKILNFVWNEIKVNYVGVYIWNEGRNFFLVIYCLF